MNLTPRQSEVLLWVQRGLSNKQIAKRLNIGESTVKLHMTAILEKHGVRNRTQLAMYSTQGQVLNLPEVSDLEREPIGWIKRSGKHVHGVVFYSQPPAEDWEPIYTKENREKEKQI